MHAVKHRRRGAEVSGRLLIDVSTLVRWTGPPVGLARVEAALAAAGRDRDALLVVYDAGTAAFRTLAPAWASALTGWSAALEPVLPARPSGLRGVLPSRLPLVARLERLRLTHPSTGVTALAGLAQAALLRPRRHSYPWRDPGGARIANLPRDLALGPEMRLGRGDVLLLAAPRWHSVPPDIAAMKRRLGFTLAVLCADLIPVTHPHFFPASEAERFEGLWRLLFGLVDLAVVNADSVAQDVAAFCRRHALPPVRTANLPLGCDRPPPMPPTGPPRAGLPRGLEPGRFALFVSTIEPRKGHAGLIRVWRRLLARGIPQAASFSLVFVGRAGWMVDAVLADLADPPERLHHLPRADDATLEALYRACAFGLYPSVTEGFGLPVIELFARGKALIGSTGGALPETIAGRSPCLDPADEAAWEATLAAWITDPGQRKPWEAAIAAAGPDPDWPEAAAAILDRAWAARSPAAGSGEARA